MILGDCHVASLLAMTVVIRHCKFQFRLSALCGLSESRSPDPLFEGAGTVLAVTGGVPYLWIRHSLRPAIWRATSFSEGGKALPWEYAALSR